MTTQPAPLSSRRHRGFDLTLCVGESGMFAFAVDHFGLALHASPATFRSPLAAERAARRFIDDALAAFDAELNISA